MATSVVQQAWALSDQAREIARSRRSAEAFSLYEQAIALAPQLAPIELDYGVALGWAGQYGQSVQVFRCIQLAQPDQPAWARLEMANAELFGGSASQAVVLFESLISEGGLRQPILTRRALALRRSGRREDAADAYRETLAYYPDSETAALGIIECFLDGRRVTEAHTFIATWSEGQPRSAQILAWRGWLLARLQRFDEANNLLGSDKHQQRPFMPCNNVCRHSTAIWRRT
jgi:tetratricopeptide (TPR) repeat protein